ncbi:MAG TPA: hypothetical protein EYP62_00305 [Kiritimatiellae bacterium]|nr:hypothetical protein [Kiritimatiellia bacterium]
MGTERSSMRLFTAESPAVAWREIIGPWFAARQQAWREAAAAVVLVPDRAFASYLHWKLVTQKRNLLGVRILTPPDLLARLWPPPGEDRTVVPREHALLVLAALEEADSGSSGDEGDSLAFASADDLYAAYDRLVGAGWEQIEALLPEPAAARLRRMEETLERLGFVTPARAVRRLLETGGGRTIGSLLIAGFDTCHWQDYPLLRAALHAAQEATVCLYSPRYHSQRLDQLWVGTWEELLGPAEPVAADPGPLQPLAALFSGLEEAPATGGDRVDFVVAGTVHAEAQAVVLKVARFLSQDPGSRIGVLVPGYGALSRVIALGLQAAGIAFNDLVGRNAAAPGEELRWNAWLALQQEPRIRRVVEAMEAGLLPCDPEHESRLRRQMEEVLRKFPGDSLALVAAAADKPPPLCAWNELRDFLHAIGLLPAAATLRDFAAAARQSLKAAGLENRAAGLEETTAALQEQIQGTVSRRTFLGWLAAGRSCSRWARPPENVVPYARVHLVPYPRAVWQEWSHLVCAGLNQHLWPAVGPHRPYLPEQLLAELNRRSIGIGSQGEGHLILTEGRGYLLGIHDEQVLRRRQFATLLEGCGCRVSLSCSRADEQDPARRRVPGDIISSLYYCCTSRALTEEELDQLQAHTESFLAASARPHPPQKDQSAALPPPQQTALAFRRRRDPGRPFDEYAFCLKSPPASPIRLHCREWEEALQHPPLVWMRRVLGVSRPAPDLDQEHWAVMVGSLVHQWLAGALRRLARQHDQRPPPHLLEGAVLDEARKTMAWTGQIYRTAGRELPVPARWIGRQARTLARDFARMLAARLPEWPKVYSEWPIPHDASWTAPDERKLLLSGRIDLVLQKCSAAAEAPAYWIVDFKTGSRTGPLTAARLPRMMRQGQGLQLILYALAMPPAKEVRISLLQPGHDLEESVSLADALRETDVLRELVRMQDQGIFGMRSPIRSEYGYSPEYPLAMLPVPSDVLEAKWQLTHPDLSGPGGNEEAGE